MRRYLNKIHGAVMGWLSRNRIPIYVATFILLFIVAYFFNRIFITVPPGHKGVLFRTLYQGTVVDKAYSEGLMLVFPWNRVYFYDTRIHESSFEINVLSMNGLTIKTKLSMRYHPDPERVGELHKTVGTDYKERILQPVVTEAVREIVGGFKPEDLYTTHRHLLADRITTEARRDLSPFPLILDGLVVASVVLPPSINKSIEEKISQQQLHLAYEFILQRAEKEVRRKELEAKGIQKYNQIVAGSLNHDLLRWLGIQATKELAESNNTKILIVGGKDGLPVIFNMEHGQYGEQKTKAEAKSPYSALEAPAGLSNEVAVSTGMESPIPTDSGAASKVDGVDIPLEAEAPRSLKPQTADSKAAKGK